MTHPRADLDFYIEPEWCTAALLELPTFSLIDAFYDPCAGSGSVVKAVHASHRICRSSDIVDRGCAMFLKDFRDVTLSDLQELIGHRRHAAVVSNPPYGRGEMTEAFVRHFMGLRLAEVVAVFVQTRFLHSAARHGFFSEIRPATIALLSTRPSCPPGEAFLAGEVKATGGSQDYCWLIYDKRHPFAQTNTVWLKRPAQAKAVAA